MESLENQKQVFHPCNNADISMDNVAEFVGLSPMSPVRSVTHESDHSQVRSLACFKETGDGKSVPPLPDTGDSHWRRRLATRSRAANPELNVNHDSGSGTAMLAAFKPATASTSIEAVLDIFAILTYENAPAYAPAISSVFATELRLPTEVKVIPSALTETDTTSAALLATSVTWISAPGPSASAVEK